MLKSHTDISSLVIKSSRITFRSKNGHTALALAMCYEEKFESEDNKQTEERKHT
jgi:hypothetical protein